MNKKLTLSFLIFSFVLFSCMKKENKESFGDLLDKIKNNLTEIENIKFRSINKYNNKYLFLKESLGIVFDYSYPSKVRIIGYENELKYDVKDLPENYYKDFQNIKKIFDFLNIHDIVKDSLDGQIEFIFDLDSINTVNIPNWDKKLDGKENRYDGEIVFDAKNELEKNHSFSKLSDKWYFCYYEKRRD